MTKNFNILVHKLNSFRFKYYVFKIFKGILLTLFLLLLVYTFFSIIEYFTYLASDIRKILFFGFVLFGFLLVFQFIFIPFLKLYRILKPIDIKKSSEIIQKHFGDVQDKLLNIMELASINDSSYSTDIISASIDQKINELRLFDFRDAVQFKNLRIIFIYFIISVITTFSLYLSHKEIFSDSTHRILHYNIQFEKPAPFSFQLINSDLQVTKGDSYQIEVHCTGNELPGMLYINISGNNYLMKEIEPGYFVYEISSVINPFRFYFTDLKYSSDNYYLRLIPKPGITHFEIEILPPEYTGLPNRIQENIGDMQVPNGSVIKWFFKGIDIDSLYFLMEDSTIIPADVQDDVFTIEKKFTASTKYHVFLKNNVTDSKLALSNIIEIVPDLYPEIEVIHKPDSSNLTRYFFKGIIGDDYGFTNLLFHYNVNNNDSSISIPVVNNLVDQDFYFSFDFTDIDHIRGSSISYYFSVSDNDVINNYKTTTSNHFEFQIPDKKAIAANEEKQFRKLEHMLEESEQLADEIQQDLKSMQMKNMNSNVSEWDKTQMVNDVISKQNRLEQLHKQIKQNNSKLNDFTNTFQKNRQDILKKQQEIEELLNDVFTDELKKLLEEFYKLAEEYDSKKFNKLAEEMNLTYDDLQKQLDRNLELLRKSNVEMQLQNVIEQVNQVSEQEEKLSRELLKNENFKKAIDEVSDHEKVIDNLMKDITNALQLNDQLERPLNFKNFDDEFEDIRTNIRESLDNLEKNELQKSGSNIKKTSEKLKSAGYAMQQMLNSNVQNQNIENINNLRQILSNLVYLSFEQEEVINGLLQINSSDPAINQLNQKQIRIQKQSEIVKDSLYALARRTPQIGSAVNNELISIDLNLKKTRSQMSEGQFQNARSSQQFVFTATNNLALILNEALENLEEQMANAEPGEGQTNNQGKKKPGMNLMQQTSDNIKEQLQRMLDKMKTGKGDNLNKELGQSLIQHEIMQQMLRDLINDSGIGSGTRKSLQQIDELLEKNRKQLMNRNVNSQMIQRQNQIAVRLLEAEKAELEREFEEDRESNSADEFYNNPVKYFEFPEKNISTLEYLNRNAHRLNNYYNTKYKQYLNNID